MKLCSASPTAILVVAIAAISATGAPAQTAYRTPPAPVPEILDAPPLPYASLDPTSERLLLQERSSLPPIADLAQPMLRLAGLRINPATNGRHGGAGLTGFTIKRLDDGSELPVSTPAEGTLGYASWSPDGGWIAFENVRDDRVEQWVADVATGEARRVTERAVNEAAGGCQWMPDSRRMLCLMVPRERGAPPEAPLAPTGPVIQETRGREAPVRTYQDLLSNAHDEALFDYYMTAQPALVDIASGEVRELGAAAVYDRVDPSPSGEFFLVERLQRPYSYLLTYRSFPSVVEVWDEQGRVVRQIADLPLADNVPIGGVRTGPRSVRWRPLRPATLVWVEALDGGDPNREVDERDRVLVLDAPFRGSPGELARTGERFAGISWGEGGIALLSDYDRSRRWMRTWILDVDGDPATRRLLWDRSREDAYGDPGSPEMTTTAAGNRVLLMDGDAIYLTGSGATPEGDRPFLDRLDLSTLKTERLWRSGTDVYETVVSVLDPGAQRILTRRESSTEPPNYMARNLDRGTAVAVTEFHDPAPQLRGISRQLVVYEREDGVPLNGTLYLPADYRQGDRLPVVMWAYPREYVSADAAGQVRSSDNRFTSISGTSHLFFLTQGYAVFDGPSMPIVGGDTANDTYVDQLVMSAEAAVDKLVEMGVGDRDRMGIGGHSYGAFMTANLLAHSDLFRAGIARSGAYNRTLTPFGFQNERRTFWEAPEIYFAMSPFMHAADVDEPILLIHGEADNNSGTFPVQSERFFHAINGLGGTARLVMLPHESHGYRARESTMHTLAEMIAWFDAHVKNAPTPTEVTSSP